MTHQRDIDGAQEVLWTVGGARFQQPDVAEEALQIAIDEWKPGQDLIQISWEIFMELLDDYGRLDGAFVHGVESIPHRYIHSKIPVMDAEDVAAQAVLSAWRSFRNFVALTPNSWDAWLFMIANNRLNSHLRNLYRMEKYIDCRPYREVYNHTVEIDRRGWSIPGICADWIEFENEDAKAAFAAQMLAMYQGQSDWVAPTGTKMQSMVQASSRSLLYKWWKEFIEEVHRRES